MAKVTAPLFGFSATGTIANSITFGNWKGVPYARQRVTPANPRSTAQSATRNVFTSMSAAWKGAPGILRNVFEDAVQGKPATARNRFIGVNVKALRGDTDLADFVASPGTRSAPGIGTVTAASGTASGAIDLTFGLPEIPSDWTLNSAEFVALVDGDPASKADWPFVTDTQASPTGSYTLTGLSGGTDYAVSVFLTFTRPDGQIAYSASRTAKATATV